jgi:hypothetical protein
MAKKNALKPCVYVNVFGMGVAISKGKNKRRSKEMVKIDVRPEALFLVTCAWCRKTTGCSTVEHSHSICEECKSGLLLTDHLTRKKQQ